jgi:hypothetical protein
MDKLFVLLVLISTALELFAAYTFGSDRSRQVNILPGILIMACSVFGFCCYFHLFSPALFFPLTLLKIVASYSTIRITECQKPLVRMHARASQQLEKGLNLFKDLIE